MEEGLIRESPMARMRKPRMPEHRPPVLGEPELRALLAACEGQDFAARRDMALVRVFLGTGARLSDIANLRWTRDEPETNDVDLDIGVIRVQGKNRRERLGPTLTLEVRSVAILGTSSNSRVPSPAT